MLHAIGMKESLPLIISSNLSDDLGRTKNENEFEILGRFDNTDVRGCNQMV